MEFQTFTIHNHLMAQDGMNGKEEESEEREERMKSRCGSDSRYRIKLQLRMQQMLHVLYE